MPIRTRMWVVVAIALTAGGAFALYQFQQFRADIRALIVDQGGQQGAQATERDHKDKHDDEDDHDHKGEPGHKAGESHDGHGHESEEHAEGAVKLTPEQIGKAGIKTAPVRSATIFRSISVPGAVLPDADRIGRVAAKVAGTVATLNKRLGDVVRQGELLGVIDSREVADAKSQYLAALLGYELQQTIFERDKTLWERQISSEQTFLRARAVAEETRIRLDVARQKLFALGIDSTTIEALPKEKAENLPRHELRAPIAGKVVDRRVNPGSPVQPETEVFVLADMSKVWVEMAVPPAELGLVKEGQPVRIVYGDDDRTGHGRVIFISPLLDNQTRSARVVAEIDNADGVWRPGTFVTAAIAVEESMVGLAVPRSALQTIGGENVVFVRTGEGFEKREVVLGKGDSTSVETTSGLNANEEIAVSNSFLLKAELGKSEAEHAH